MLGLFDQWALYTMVRLFKPKRILEVGSGFSTQLMHAASLKNNEEGHDTKITCIEPFRGAALDPIKCVRLPLPSVRFFFVRKIVREKFFFVFFFFA